MQAVWLTILDDKFMHAYIHGIELDFIDNDPYIFLPRIFTDSNDYPEKYVYPSPQCFSVSNLLLEC